MEDQNPNDNKRSQDDHDDKPKQGGKTPGNGEDDTKETTEQSFSALSRLEEEVVAKTQARSNPSARPGAVSVPPVALSQREQDAQSKAAARRGSGGTRPGAVSVPAPTASSLQALEDSVLSKTGGTAPSAAPSSVASSLQQMEHDLIAKTQAVGGRRGASAPTSSGQALSQCQSDAQAKAAARVSAGAASTPSSLTQLQRDVMEKQAAAGGMPGTSVSSDLQSLEADVIQKTQSVGRRGSASRPGAVAVSNDPSAARSGLSELERQIVNKTQGGGDTSTSSGQALSQRQSDAQAKAAARASAGAASTPSSLTQLQRDVMEKQAAAGGMPGTSVSSDLQSLEADVIQKTQAGGSGRASQPGAVSVDAASSQLSSFERSIVEKTQGGSDGRGSQPGVVPVSAASSQLNSFERSIVEKTQAVGGAAARTEAASKSQAAVGRGLGTPGAVSVPSSGTSSLSEMERSILEKTQGGPPATARGSKPGVVSVGANAPAALSELEESLVRKTQNIGGSSSSAPSQLQQMELDARTKSMGRGPGQSMPGATPVSLDELEDSVLAKAGATSAAARAALSQRERDAMSKAQLKKPPPGSLKPPPGSFPARSSQPGAVASSLEDLEDSVLAKTQGGVPSRQPRAVASSLEDLEDSVLAKTHGSVPRRQPGAVASSLEDLEDSVLAKSHGGSGTGPSRPAPSNLNSLEEAIIQKTQTTGGISGLAAGHSTPQGGSAIERLESELLAKQGVAVAPGPYSTAGYGQTMSIGHIEQMQENIAAKARQSFAQGNSAADVASTRPGVQPTAVANMRELEHNITSKTRDAGGMEPTIAPPEIVAPVSRGAPIAPLEVEMPIPAGSSPMSPNGGIEAFVAETVIAPTGVDVIMSEEEEEELERSKQKKLLYGGILCLAVIVAAVVIGVVIAGGGGGGGDDGPTEIPTASPTATPTLAPTSVYFTEVVDYLEEFSGDAVKDRSTPQFQAAYWISEFDIFAEQVEFPSQKFLERYALAVFYFAAGGPDWDTCNELDPDCTGVPGKGWLSANDACDWFRVMCNQEGFVTQLDFVTEIEKETGDIGIGGDRVVTEPMILRGTIPPEVNLLSSMQYFLVAEMALSGTLGSGPTGDLFSSWTNVVEVRLDNNQFIGKLPSFTGGTHPLLRKLDMSHNQFTGQVPSTLGNLLDLELLALGSNNLKGPVPSTLGNLGSLTSLELYDNDLTGPIPIEIYSVDSLKVLDLQKTNITGSISPLIDGLSNLERLALGDTNMGGVFPAQFFNLTLLKEIYLRNCNFSGDMPEASWSRFVDLVDLDLANNDMTGPIPQVLGNLVNLKELKLQGNRLTGSIIRGSALCNARGTTGSGIDDLQVLTVGCDVTCECCDDFCEN